MAARKPPTPDEGVDMPETKKATTILVETGDTWDTVAQRAGSTADELLAANYDHAEPGQRPPLVVGQELFLP